MTRWSVFGRLSQISRLLLLLALAAGWSMAFGQEVRSSITGRVTDSTGAALPSVNVTITNQQTGVETHTVTDSTGNYTVPELDPGVYSVTAVKNGFQKNIATGLELLAQQTLRRDVTMQVGAASQTVQVSAEAPLIDTENGTIATPIQTVQLRSLPTTIQDIDSFLILAAGVGRATFNSAPQIAGSTHWGADNFTLNGVSVNDPGNGGGSYSFGLGGVNLPALSSLQEVQVGGIGMDARYSRIVNVQMVTKAGTNQFHGDAFEFFRNDVLNSNLWQNNFEGASKAKLRWNEFGATLGGPIKRDKLFFFVDYQGQR
ncbi:MAG: carboxypeptidase-like regulatory domain-containing protein, partial [Terracidiphilus sp.]